MGTETILLVEAEPADVAMMSASLKREGYRVLAAGNYDTALGIFDQNRDDIDFLVTDISGSEQEFDGTRILGCFLENHKFGPGRGHALSLQQQVT